MAGSITIIDTPEIFQPVYSDGLFFTVSADTTNTFKFRYVYELYVEDEMVFTGKVTPNPENIGVMDLSRILKTYTENNPIAVWDTTNIYVHQTFPFARPYQSETINYFLKIGYEYASSEIGQITGFTGIGTAIGPPAYPTGIYKTFQSTMGVNGRATQQSFDIGPFSMTGTPASTIPQTTGLFLTNSPRIRDIQETEYYTLGFTNWFLGGNVMSEPYYVEYKFYDDQGILITATTYDNITVNGGGPRPNCTSVYASYLGIYDLSATTFNTLYVGAGPANIPYFPSNCAQYTVQLYGVFEGTTSPIQPSPTPTPSPTATPPSGTTTPTPTPSSTPPCTGCTRYSIYHTNEGVCLVSTTNCTNGASQTFTAEPNILYEICSCSYPITECEITIINEGSCTTPTPTPTRTPTPTPSQFCACRTYRVTAFSYEPGYADYIDCYGEPQSEYIPRNGQVQFCACTGSVDYSGTLTDLGACTP